MRDRILEAKARGATIVLNSHQLAEVEKVCDRVVFIDHGRLTQSETLTGDAASRRRAAIRVEAVDSAPGGGDPRARGLAVESGDGGLLRLPDAGAAEIARAVKALALADVAVLEVRSSAELEELFREAPPS